MSYIVKGAEMPRKCEDCIFLSFHGAGDYPYCIVTGTKKDCTFIPKLMTERMDSCPLAELPPHGRLIDADKLLKEAKRLSGPMTGDGWDNWGVYALIERQPTIIEAEEAKE